MFPLFLNYIWLLKLMHMHGAYVPVENINFIHDMLAKQQATAEVDLDRGYEMD